jgi:hypothetical protein
MIIALHLQFHDYRPHFAICDTDKWGSTPIEKDVLQEIFSAQSGYARIERDGRKYQDEFGVFGGELDAHRLTPPVNVERFVALTIWFE